jgi:hypothetical protein
MRSIILACALVGICVPANAHDGTQTPPNVGQAFNGTPLPPDTVPTFQPAPLDLPPLLLSQAANPGGTAGQGVDPLIGTWKLNVEKSTSSTGSVPKSLTTTYVGEGQNFSNTVEGVNAQGKPFKIINRHIYDGMPHPTTGTPDYDSTTYTRVGNTINIVRFRQGKTVEVGQIVIVPGKTYTVTAEGIAVNGQQYHYVFVEDRQ